MNSALVQSARAEVGVTLWFENCEVPNEIFKDNPLPNWVWNYKKLQTTNGKVAETIYGHQIINKNEESNLYTWYTIMAQELVKTGGQIYLDERIPQAVDISNYLCQKNAIPSQWSRSGNLLSVAAYQKDIPTGINAGHDYVNIQLLSRGKNTEGQTVLAIPVLLEEF